MPLVLTKVHKRGERRVSVGIQVVLHAQEVGSEWEQAFTENVSPRGARLLSAHRWEKGELLSMHSRGNEFRTSARVVYCHPLHGDSYAVGVEFLESKGRWVV